MGKVRFRFATPGQGRYCEVHDGAERCDAAFTYDSVGMTYLPDDSTKRVYRAVLIEPDIFVHCEVINGVKFHMGSYAEAAFDSDAALRERARASVARRRLALAEVRRRRGQGRARGNPE